MDFSSGSQDLSGAEARGSLALGPGYQVPMRAGARLLDRGTRRNPEFSNLCGAVPPSLPTNLALLLAGEAAHMRTYSKRGARAGRLGRCGNGEWADFAFGSVAFNCDHLRETQYICTELCYSRKFSFTRSWLTELACFIQSCLTDNLRGGENDFTSEYKSLSQT